MHRNVMLPTPFASMRRLVRRLVLRFALVIGFGGALVGTSAALDTSPVWAGELKVGVVDFTYALEKTESDGALAKLKKDAERRQKELSALEDEILALEEELQESGPIVSDDVMKEKLMAYQKKAYEYRQALLLNEKEFEETKRDVLAEIHREMEEISVEIAQDNGLDLMIERNEGAVVYFDNTFDYTDELIRRYEARK